MKTKYGYEISRDMINSKVEELIGRFFKILPLREHGSNTIKQYMESLLRELLGLEQLMLEWRNDGQLLTLMGILQYHIDHPDCDLSIVRSDVFKAINIINFLREKYTDKHTDRG
jgi:hypothetical protein